MADNQTDTSDREENCSGEYISIDIYLDIK